MLCQHYKSCQNISYATLTYSSSLLQQHFLLKDDIKTLQIFIWSLDTNSPLNCDTWCLIQALCAEPTTLSLTKTLSTTAMPTLNQIRQVTQAESDHIIKELKAPSSLAASRLYAKTTHFFINTTPMLEACVLAHASCEITIKSGSETLKQHLQTGQDIIWDRSKVIGLLNVVLATCCLSSRDVTIFFNSEWSCFTVQNLSAC